MLQNSIVVGSGAATGNVLIINGGMVTNAANGNYIGNGAGGNSLTISNGGQFVTGNLDVGYNSAGASNNAYNVGGLGAASLSRMPPSMLSPLAGF